jgi:CBS domain-containing protein
MNVSEIMTTNVATAEPDSTLEEVATMMKDENVGAIPVVDGDELVGIVTDRDIVVRCIAEGKDPSECEVEQIVTEDLETVSPDDDVRRAAEIMQRRQIRRLPVCDADGKLVGMLSLGDIAVKQSNDGVSGETLEQVSQGVKGEQRKAGKSTSGSSADKKQQSRGERANRQGQGITNRSSEEEMERQERVVSIREEGKAGKGRKRAS